MMGKERHSNMNGMKTLALAAAAVGVCAATPYQNALEVFVAEHGQSVSIVEGSHGLAFAGRFVPDPVAGPADLVAEDFLARWSVLLGVDPWNDLFLESTRTMGSLSYVRFAQSHDAVTVEGAAVVVTIDPYGSVRQVSSTLVDPLAGFAPSTPSLSSVEALEIVADRRPDLATTGSSRLVYVRLDGGTARLAWVLRSHSLFGPEAPDVYVDAHGGAILMAPDANVYVDGYVFDPSPAIDSSLYRRELPNITSATNLDGQYARSFGCDAAAGIYCEERIRRAVPDAGGNYLYMPEEPSLDDPFSEVMAYYTLDRINRHMEDEYGHVYECDGHRWMDVFVNMNYPNAWYGDGNDDDECPDLTIGQGTYDFAYDMSIVFHEFGHGINHDYTRFRRNYDALGIDNSSTGIDEGFSDYWAATLMDNSLIGAYADSGATSDAGIRDVGGHATCPEGLYGEGHYDSPIWSTTMWDIRGDIGATKTDILALATLASIAERSSFDEGGRALVAQAEALRTAGVFEDGDVTAVESAVDDHQLIDCLRVLTMADGDARILFGGRKSWETGGASSVQFSMYAPPSTSRLSAKLDLYEGSGDYTVYVKKGTYVGFEGWAEEMVVSDFDYAFPGSPTYVTFTEWSDPPIESDTTYTFAWTNTEGTLVLSVEAIIVTHTIPDAIADAVEDTVSEPDVAGDVPEDTEPDPVDDVPADTDLDVVDDVPEDTGDPGHVTGGGCACSLV
jgi:hypothetical protein